MIRIGSLNITCRAFLAPIAGYTDLAFRLVVRAAGHQGFTYTELLNPRGILHQTPSTLDIARVREDDEPFGVQLYGNDADWFCEAARWAESIGASVLDINMGCPVDKVTKTNGGSMLLCDPDRTTRMVERVVDSVGIPVTAKLRLGWTRKTRTAPRLARQLEAVGVRLITIHGRTTEDYFKGTVDLEGIAEVVAAVDSIPVIGNGDIKTPEDARRMVEATGCAGVMVARASIKRPWLLRDIDALLRTGIAPPEPTVREKISLIRLHFDLVRDLRDDAHAIKLMRQRIAHYGSSMGHIKPFKERVRLMRSVSAFYDAMDELESLVDPDWTSVPKRFYHERLEHRSSVPAPV
ncbi:MAG: tRNA dihydrouridine synthase DusB [Phycisphaerales bacterium]